MKKTDRVNELKEPKVLYVFEDKAEQDRRAWRWLWFGPILDVLLGLIGRGR